MHELPLVLFSLLAQLSVGAFVTLGIVTLTALPRHSAKVVDRLADPALYAIGPAMVVGLVVSMLHLGSPLNALNSFRHLSSSWLSREVFFGSLFAAFGFAFAVLQWRRWGSRRLRQVLAGLTALIGVALMVSMAGVYLQPTVPAWNHWTTPVQFFLSAALLGSLTVGVALAAAPSVPAKLHKWVFPDSDPLTSAEETHVDTVIAGSLRWISVTAMVLLPMQLLVMVFATLPRDVVDAPVIEVSGVQLAARGVLLILGAGLLGSFVYTRATGQAKRSTLLVLVTTALILTFVAEFIGRIMFYDAHLRVGI